MRDCVLQDHGVGPAASFLGPVTALAPVDRVVLVGSGSFLTVQDRTTRRCLHRYAALPLGCQLHGIRTLPMPNRTGVVLVAVYGLHDCRLWALSLTDYSLSQLDDIVPPADDCILDLVVLDRQCVAIGMAHNVVDVYRRESSAATWSRTCRHRCTDTSLLYSMRIYAAGAHRLRIASGTVFNEILLWAISNDAARDAEHDAVQRLRGHKGVIFNVAWSNDGRRLTSSSDDRTVRCWEDTGDCLWVGRRHGARVWRTLIDNGRACVISAGEDGLICRWDLRTGDLLDDRRVSSGSVWSIALDEGSGTVVAGSADGVWHCQAPLSTDSAGMMTTRVSNPLPTSSFVIGLLTVSGGVVAVCRNGDILFADDRSDDTFDVVRRLHVETRTSCVLDDRQTVAVATNDAVLFVDGHSGEDVHDQVALSCVFKVWSMPNRGLLAYDGTHLHWKHPSGTWSKVEARGNVSSTGVVDNTTIVIGDVTGNAYLLVSNDSTDAIDIVQRLPRLHGRSIVKAIAVVDDRTVITFGADGSACTLQYDHDASRLHMMASSTSVQVDRVVSVDPELVTVAFDTRRHAFSVTLGRRHILALVPVQARTSAYDVSLSSGLRFMYVDRRQRAIIRVSMPECGIAVNRTTFTAFHTRQVCDVRWVAPDRLITTGEDGTVRCCSVDDDLSVECAGVVEPSGIKRTPLRCLSKTGDLVIAAGARQQMLCCRRSALSSDALQVVYHDIVSGFASRRGKWFRKSPGDLQAERQLNLDVRFTSVDAFDETILTGDSIGRVSRYLLKSNGTIVSVAASAPGTGHGHHPVLVCRTLPALGISITGDTRGRIVVWDLTSNADKLAPLADIAGVHQNGINGMVCHLLDEAPGVLIITCGDDHSLQVTRLTIDTGRVCTAVRGEGRPGAHASPVMAVGIDRAGRHVLSVGTDRYLHRWRIDGLRLERCRGSVQVDVADAAAMSIYEHGGSLDVAIVGCGLQVLRIPTPFLS
ncbi:WD domain, G-beta repeat [Plasmodiophora brassicae]